MRTVHGVSAANVKALRIDGGGGETRNEMHR